MYLRSHTAVVSGKPFCTIHLRPICAAETPCESAMASTSGLVITFSPPLRLQLLPLKPPHSGE